MRCTAVLPSDSAVFHLADFDPEHLTLFVSHASQAPHLDRSLEKRRLHSILPLGFANVYSYLFEINFSAIAGGSYTSALRLL